MKRKLVATLACRNQGSRLYGKPLQNLDIDSGLSILDYMIEGIKTYECVDEIVLAISEGTHNVFFKEVAEKHNIKYVIGSEENVLLRLIQAADLAEATDIFRVTTESPFTYYEALDSAWNSHVEGGFDVTALDNLPDGSGFELIKLQAYKDAQAEGEERHRSELCSLFLRENKDRYKFNFVEIPKHLKRLDIRLTVDYPEDLVLCRAVYNEFKDLAPRIPLDKIIPYLDSNEPLKQLVDPFIEDGLKTMYV